MYFVFNFHAKRKDARQLYADNIRVNEIVCVGIYKKCSEQCKAFLFIDRQYQKGKCGHYG